ncbi:hypothetical protein [Geotalea uraniireducens]|uniref:Uncharacterized protein n=1 Tax=Geotalea uraniireducens (strain Rf4) TaxID=351605 RepID=A5G601_GEOUR|nr:hypothetical protein [Geotalea uraniireducens]ABQ27219.1 hypothetical protein Gura_3047 [Geotalea uraniireducens Rf4]
MGRIVLVAMVLLPRMVFAATDCRVVEYPDHYEAVCVGSEKYGPVQAKTAVQEKAPPQAQTPVQAQEAAQAQTAAKAPSPAVQALIAYRERLPNKSLRDAAKASRMRLIQEERQKQLDKPAKVDPPMPDMMPDSNPAIGSFGTMDSESGN